MVPQFVDSKLMTRETYTLYGVEGDFKSDGGKLTFTEKVSSSTWSRCRLNLSVGTKKGLG